MTETRPSIDQQFLLRNRVYRVTAIGPSVVVGTLIAVEGEPTNHSQLATLTRQQFAQLPAPTQ